MNKDGKRRQSTTRSRRRPPRKDGKNADVGASQQAKMTVKCEECGETITVKPKDKDCFCEACGHVQKIGNRRQNTADIQLAGATKNGKRTSGRRQPKTKTPSKYTIVRTPQDIDSLENVRRILALDNPGLSLKTDSEVYRILPGEYQNAVERIRELDHQVEDLTAKLAELEELRASIRRILELTSEKP